MSFGVTAGLSKTEYWCAFEQTSSVQYVYHWSVVLGLCVCVTEPYLVIRILTSYRENLCKVFLFVEAIGA